MPKNGNIMPWVLASGAGVADGFLSAGVGGGSARVSARLLQAEVRTTRPVKLGTVRERFLSQADVLAGRPDKHLSIKFSGQNVLTFRTPILKSGALSKIWKKKQYRLNRSRKWRIWSSWITTWQCLVSPLEFLDHVVG